MDKLIYVNGKGKSVYFGVNEDYHVNINLDVIGINDIENDIYTNNTNFGANYLGFRTKQKEIRITGHIATKDKNEIKEKIKKLNHCLYPDGEGKLFYVGENFVKVIPCVAETAPKYSRSNLIYKFEIDFICLENYWSDELESFRQIANWESLLEFPINCEDYIEFGSRQTSLIVNVYNEGDIESPVRIKFIAKGDVLNPELINVYTGEFIKLNISLVHGDEVEITSDSGAKKVTLIKNKVRTNIFNKLIVGSKFLNLSVGDNLFRYNATSGIDNMDIVIYYKNKYLSV